MKTNNPEILTYLDALLRTGNFTKASQQLFISQPYLTQTIKHIEQQLGTIILSRQSVPLQLTQAGKLYYQYLEQLTLTEAQFHKSLNRLNHPDFPRLRLGILPSLGTFFLPLLLPGFSKNFPDVKIDLFEALPNETEHRLLHGELDLVIGQNPEIASPQLTMYECQSENYLAVIGQTHPLYQKAKQTPIETEELLNQALILTTSGSAIRRQIDQLFMQYRQQPIIKLETAHIYTAILLAQEGLGITFAPQSAIEPFQNRNQALHLPISSTILCSKYYIAHERHMTLTKETQAFIHHFLQVFAHYQKQTK